jgi:hypothetical protein
LYVLGAVIVILLVHLRLQLRLVVRHYVVGTLKVAIRVRIVLSVSAVRLAR